MNKVFTIGLFLSLLITFAFSQDGIHAREGRFLKRIENNMYGGHYNLVGKRDFEKRFFGDFNARIEFFDEPYFEEASGFRIVRRGSLYTLEVKYVSDFQLVEKMFEDKLKSAWASNNKVDIQKISEEKKNSYRIATRSIPISNQFAEKLYEKIASFIVNFKATEVDHPDIVPICMDGDPVTFRTVVNVELWSLWIACTQGNTRKMADLCRKIVTDVRTNKFSELKYIYYELNTIED